MSEIVRSSLVENSCQEVLSGGNSAASDEMTRVEDTSSALRDAPTLGEYKLISKIGQGGIAEIFKAIQNRLNREVAVKILSSKLSSDPDIVRRFDRESKTVARLNHPNIVQVIDRGFAQGRYYFVMEYIEGASFKEVMASKEVSLLTKLEIVVMVLKGLDYAHKNGVIHRDIKPANILIDIHGNAKVADFGIAQIVNAPEEEMTATGIIMGTMAYMSPEQKLSSGKVNSTTDIYAIGVMIYEILVGEKPLGDFKMPSELNGKIPRKFDEIIRKCLARESSDRYQTAVSLKDALLEVMSSQTKKRRDPTSGAIVSVEDILGRCNFLDTIRETKYGSTYLVEGVKTNKLYVIKSHTKDGAGLKEAKLLAEIEHENIVNILGAGGDSRKTVIVSEYAPGGSLADRLIRKYKWDEVFGVGEQIASGLSVAHKMGIVHGNLRPSNILFDENETVKLSDFGMPSHYETTKNWYAPPEKGSSMRGDIYSLGVVLHQMMLGRMMSYDKNGELQFDEIKLSVPSAVKEMLAKLLSNNCATRYQSVDI
ncbi:MAG: serine/threonine protein kinase, partial [candidate division Zixibacteria bacterium]|nr:serine/threonine protein kinase [candidate division Zixibacteria bacterium]